MMKKRISILTLALLFLVSTTGMPIWSHYCEMIGKKSLSECGDCKIEEVEVVSCCSEMTSENQLQYASENSNCCIDEFDYKKIEDKKYSQQTNYNLPPPKFGKQLLNTIHQLKLDLPFC
jgi:hypothetical protein